MSDETKSTPALGSRIRNAHARGLAAAEAGKDRASNPVNVARPKMVLAWFAGFDSFSAT